MIAGAVLARGTNVQYTAEIDYQDVEVLDNIEVDEFAPVAYRVNGSIGMIKKTGVTPKSLGLIPETGQGSDEHLENILLQADITLVLIDKKTPEARLATLTGVKFGSYGWAVAARGIATENIVFKAIRETDESE
jgi:hypothetical protein